jgi:two-component system response regulator YesN
MFDFDEIPGQDVERYDIVFSSIRKSVGEELVGLCDFDMFSRYEKLCLLLKYKSKPDIKALEQRIERIIQRAGRYSDMPLSAGISSVISNSKNFSMIVKEASRALEYRSVMGGQKVFLFENSQHENIRLSVDDSKIKELGYMLHSQTLQDCIEWIDSIRNTIINSRDSLYYAATGILNILIRGCDDIGGLYANYGGLDKLYRKLFEIKTDEEIYDYLKELISQVRELNDGVIVDNVERSLHLVMSYLETHFCDPDISFESLAREVSFSVSYISALLKKRLNTSFVKMLTELRIEKAKELLSNPALKIIDIAEQLGYNDSYYFSHCFKKHVGIPPKEYRNEQIKQAF